MSPLKNYAEAAEWLGVPMKWLEAQVQQGKAPHTRLGKHVRFTQAHLDEIVAAGERKPRAVAPAGPPAHADRIRPASRRKRPRPDPRKRTA